VKQEYTKNNDIFWKRALEESEKFSLQEQPGKV
jgi:hypothetical protein